MVRATARWMAGLLLVLLGAARGLGAVALLAGGWRGVPAARAGRDERILLSIGLLVVAYVAVWAGLALLLRREYAGRLALVALASYVAGGLLNGYVLAGATRPWWALGNVAVAVVVGVLAVLGARAPA